MDLIDGTRESKPAVHNRDNCESNQLKLQDSEVSTMEDDCASNEAINPNPKDNVNIINLPVEGQEKTRKYEHKLGEHINSEVSPKKVRDFREGQGETELNHKETRKSGVDKMEAGYSVAYKVKTGYFIEDKVKSENSGEIKVETGYSGDGKVETVDSREDKVETRDSGEDKVESGDSKEVKVETGDSREEKVETGDSREDNVEKGDSREDKVETVDSEEYKAATEELEEDKDNFETSVFGDNHSEISQSEENQIETLKSVANLKSYKESGEANKRTNDLSAETHESKKRQGESKMERKGSGSELDKNPKLNFTSTEGKDDDIKSTIEDKKQTGEENTGGKLLERRRASAPSTGHTWPDFQDMKLEGTFLERRRGDLLSPREVSVLQGEEICPSCFIPIYTNSQTSLRNSSNPELVHEEGVTAKIFSPSEIPFGLKKLNRTPKDILEKKVGIMKHKDSSINVQEMRGGGRLSSRFSFPPSSHLQPPPLLNPQGDWEAYREDTEGREVMIEFKEMERKYQMQECRLREQGDTEEKKELNDRSTVKRPHTLVSSLSDLDSSEGQEVGHIPSKVLKKSFRSSFERELFKVRESSETGSGHPARSPGSVNSTKSPDSGYPARGGGNPARSQSRSNLKISGGLSKERIWEGLGENNYLHNQCEKQEKYTPNLQNNVPKEKPLRLENWIMKKAVLLEKISVLKMKLSAVYIVHRDKQENKDKMKISIFADLKRLEYEVAELNGFQTSLTHYVFMAVDWSMSSKIQECKPLATHSDLERKIERMSEDLEMIKLYNFQRIENEFGKLEYQREPVNKRLYKVFGKEEVSPLSRCPAANLRIPPPPLVPAGTLHAAKPPPLVKAPIPLGMEPCMKFKDIFDIAAAGQLFDICQGPNGSKFVMKRLREGTLSERRCAFDKLRLPKQLLNIIGTEPGKDVISTLMVEDTPSRMDLIRHIKNSLSNLILSKHVRDLLCRFIEVFKSAHHQNRHLSILEILTGDIPGPGEKLKQIVSRVDSFLEELISKRK